MTENSPFGGLAVADPHAPALPGDFDDATDTDNRRKLAIVGAIAGVVVLLIAAFFLMKGGGSGNTASPVVPHITPPTTGAQPATVAHKPAKPVKLPKAYSAPVGRDPFKALYTPPAPAASAAPGTGTGTPADNTVNGTGTTGATAPTPVWVELVSVNGSSATFIVAFNNGSSLATTKFRNVPVPSGTAGPTVFAGVFGLLSVHNGNATIQYGDGTPLVIQPGPAHRLVVS